MHTLTALYAYNRWANTQVFAVCRTVDRARLEADAAGTFGSLDETLKHMVQVEDVYLRMLREEPLDRMERRDAYLSHDLAWFETRATELSEGYGGLLAGAASAFYDETLSVPWFDFALTKHDGLLQVLSHSAQHRAQVFSALGQHGVDVPDLDFVLFVAGGRGNPQ